MILKTIAIANQKGGVGKTTTAVNIATSLAAVGKAVLIIDFDPQGNATTGLGIDKNTDGSKTIYSILAGEDDINECILNTEIGGLDIIPADINLSASEIEMVSVERSQFVLKQRLSEVEKPYDVCIIDCPPSLGFLTINSLVAANSVLIPLQCEFYALEGLSHLIKTLKIVKANLNSLLEIEGIVLTMYDKRNKLTEQIEEDVRGFMPGKVYETVIPRNVKLSEAPSHGKPALIYDVNCVGSLAYISLAREMIIKNSFDVNSSSAI